MNELKQKKKRLKHISWIKLKMTLLDKLTTLKEKKKKRKRIISKWTKEKLIELFWETFLKLIEIIFFKRKLYIQ